MGPVHVHKAHARLQYQPSPGTPRTWRGTLTISRMNAWSSKVGTVCDKPTAGPTTMNVERLEAYSSNPARIAASMTWTWKHASMCVPIVFVQLNPPFRAQNVSFLGACRCQPCHKFHKKRGHSAEIKKQHENTTVLNKQNALSAYSNAGGIVNWHPLKLCCHKKKNINDRTPSWSAVPFLRLVLQNRYPSTLGNVYALWYHIRQTCPVKECWGSRNGAFFGTRRGRDAHPKETRAHV